MRWVRNFLGVLLFLSLLVLLAAVGGTYWYLRSFQREWTFEEQSSNLALFIPLREVDVAAADGRRLRGWIVRQNQAAPVVWILPDIGESRLAWWNLMTVLYDWGYHVVVFNLRGHQPSEGRFSWGAALEGDLKAISDYLRTSAYPSARWGLLGHGLGSYLALRMLCRWPDVQLVILEDPVQTPLDRMTVPLRWSVRIPPEVWKAWWRTSFRWMYGDVPEDAGLRCLVEKPGARIPAVVLTSPQWPRSYVEAFYARLPEPKELLEVPHAPVGGLSERDSPQYLNTFQVVLNRYLPRDVSTIPMP
ncbi:MAG: alpha/beta hydrolase [Acidobacteria bacterium]|nr:alpha/beta hydrolase [Acidobacteriota bacterium]MDW7983640.1 alpha/beta hydrolase [Acidobacteriota bacterium]